MGATGRPYGPWVRLVAAATVSAVIGLLAAMWGSEAWAGVLGAAVAALVSAAAVGAQTEWQRQTEAARRRPGALEITSPGGRFPLVRELRDPIALGVHPAETIEQAVHNLTQRPAETFGVPMYVTRDMEPHLHAALRRGGFILLVGESTAGKTRAAYEAIRLLHPDHQLVAPSTREAMQVLLDGWEAPNGCVVWLDDLERFLRPVP